MTSVVAERSALAERIRAVLAIDPAAPGIEFEGRWRSWSELARTAEAAAAQVVRPGAPIGIVLRNRPLHVAMMLGVVMGGGCVVTVNPGRGEERTRADIAGLDLDVLMGAPDDLAAMAPSGDRHPVLVSGADVGTDLQVMTSGVAHRAAELAPGVAVRMLTSGTTGPPKRIDLGADTLERMLVGAKHYESKGGESGRSDGAVLRRGVAIVNSPLVHLGGLFRILQCVCDGRSFALLERFTVDAWADVVRRHRPKTVSLVPAALRTVLESDVAREDLSSVLSVISGTAPLSPDDADAFYARFGVPVLTSYAATEFAGGVAGWNLSDFREFGATKRGSVGRAHAGCALRVVDGDSGAVLAAGEVGLLEVKAAQLGPGTDWMRTTDLARLDADGFLWIVGRADQAIIRGGFKVHPTEVARTLEAHPGVRGAVVFGIDDARLGAVPVALVELRAGATLTDEDLLAHARGSLSGYEVPTEVRFAGELPRTDSGKIDLAAAREAFEKAG